MKSFGRVRSLRNGIAAFLATALFAAQCFAAPVLTNLGSTTNSGGGTTSIAITTVAGVTAHHTIILAFCIASNTDTVSSISDGGDTFTQVGSTLNCNGAGTGHAFVYKVQDPAGFSSGQTITINYTSSAAFASACAATIDGTTTLPPTADTAGPGQTGAFSTGAVNFTPGVTPAGSSPYITAAIAATTAITSSQSWSEDTTHNWIQVCSVNNAFHQPAVHIAYQVPPNSSPIVYAPTLGTDNTDSWFADELSFDTGASAGGATQHRGLLVGVGH